VRQPSNVNNGHDGFGQQQQQQQQQQQFAAQGRI
jgi:hypothetical protein